MPHIWHPWPHRLFGKWSISPLWVWLGVSLVALAALLVSWVIGGELAEFAKSGRGILEERDLRFALTLCALVGLIPASQQYMLGVTQANLRALEPLLGRGAESPELPRPSLWLCILPGVLAMPAIGYGIDRDLSFYFQRDYLSTTHAFQWAVGWFCTVNAALSTYLTFACSRAMAERVEAIPRIDLLDLTPLYPFARQGIQTLLVWLLTLSIISVNATDPDFLLPLIVMSILCLANSAIAAVMCNRTLHHRIQKTKRDKLLLVNAALRGDVDAREGLLLAPPGEGASLGAADLLAYRRFVEESREWALDTSAWLRTALYLALPLGSWLGGALVERALEASLR